ncbi:CDC20-2 [Scenedesmus sp. PABB004]|nr:CDC20-2 [Scenedesmus sp. PABB004]
MPLVKEIRTAGSQWRVAALVLGGFALAAWPIYSHRTNPDPTHRDMYAAAKKKARDEKLAWMESDEMPLNTLTSLSPSQLSPPPSTTTTMSGLSMIGVQAPSPLSKATPGKAFKHTPGGSKKEKLDRFIPSRSGTESELPRFELGAENEGGAGGEAASQQYQSLLAASLNITEQQRILAFKHKAPAPPEHHQNNLASLYTANTGAAPARRAFRHIPTTQERILDAPDLVDDYYLNLLDWSSGNTVAVALGPTVYLWNAASGTIDELCTSPNEGDYITSVQWAADSTHLAVGTSTAKVQIWDAARAKQVKELPGHTNRVSALAWNNAILSSGGRDSLVCNWDVRLRKHEACVATLRGHDQEVCGLKWSPNGTQLASGGNDNVLCIWGASGQQQHRIAAHQAAVKALAWCPFQSNLLASGGGTADRCIRFWNTTTGAQLNHIDTGSQAAELTGHTARVLHMAQSPDGSTVVTAGADETLRFWRVFGEPAGKAGKAAAAASGSAMMRSASIR